jgi:hypothetical protein
MSGWQGAQALHAEQGHAVVYKSMTDCFARTVREEGFKALFKVRFFHPDPPRNIDSSMLHCMSNGIAV